MNPKLQPDPSGRRPPSPRLRVPPALMALLAAGLTITIPSCKKPAPAAPPPPTVEVVAIEQQDVPVYREWVGSLAADVNATISAQVSGYLLRQDYKEGQNVKQGDLLFEIDDRTYQASLDQANAKYGKTQLDVQRYTPLAKTQAISQQELDDAIQANIAAKAEVDAAQLNVNYCKIIAPVDGIAGLANAQIGDLVGPGSGQLTSVTKNDPIRAYFSVDQQLMVQIQQKTLAAGGTLRQITDQPGGPVLELVLVSGTVYPEKGRVRFANNQLDVRTGTIRVVGEFPNPQGLLLPGMFVTVRALMDTQTNALVVPQRAITDMQGRSLIAIVGEDDKVSIRPVTPGVQSGQSWVITGDIKAGDRVVAEGIQKVREGMVVNPVPFGSAPAAGSETPAAKSP
jgi:membrane fusion protein, multidrug efflux system